LSYILIIPNPYWL